MTDKSEILRELGWSDDLIAAVSRVSQELRSAGGLEIVGPEERPGAVDATDFEVHVGSHFGADYFVLRSS